VVGVGVFTVRLTGPLSSVLDRTELFGLIILKTGPDRSDNKDRTRPDRLYRSGFNRSNRSKIFYWTSNLLALIIEYFQVKLLTHTYGPKAHNIIRQVLTDGLKGVHTLKCLLKPIIYIAAPSLLLSF